MSHIALGLPFNIVIVNNLHKNFTEKLENKSGNCLRKELIFMFVEMLK